MSTPEPQIHPADQHEPVASEAGKATRRFVGRRRAEASRSDSSADPNGLIKISQPAKAASRVLQTIPLEILENVELNESLKALPSHYNFEVHKTVRKGVAEVLAWTVLIIAVA